jgi:hypothetical protein
MRKVVGGDKTINWETFKEIAAGMIPRTLNDKIELFLESFTP